MTENSAREGGEPAGEVYDWYVRGRTLLEGGNPEAAAELLTHACEREPESASVLEALARALFDARRYGEAADRFTELVETSPDNDYARFGLGLSRMRLGDLTARGRAAGAGRRDAPGARGVPAGPAGGAGHGPGPGGRRPDRSARPARRPLAEGPSA